MMIIGKEIAKASHLFLELFKKVAIEAIKINAQMKFTPIKLAPE